MRSWTVLGKRLMVEGRTVKVFVVTWHPGTSLDPLTVQESGTDGMVFVRGKRGGWRPVYCGQVVIFMGNGELMRVCDRPLEVLEREEMLARVRERRN